MTHAHPQDSSPQDAVPERDASIERASRPRRVFALISACAAFALLFASDAFLRAEAQKRAGPPFLDFAEIYDFDAGFEEPLAWDPEDPATDRIPERVRKLSGRSFSLEGYMQALAYDEEGGELVTQFVFTPKPVGCCTGHVPYLQEQILVHVDGAGTENRVLGTCVVEGSFRVEPVIDDEGDVLVLFQMRADRVRGRGIMR